jgi:hypothetical protein
MSAARKRSPDERSDIRDCPLHVATLPRVSLALTRATGLCAKARRVALPRGAFFQFPAFFPASEGNHPKPLRQSGNVIASAAKQSRGRAGTLDCFVGCASSGRRVGRFAGWRNPLGEEKILPLGAFSLE